MSFVHDGFDLSLWIISKYKILSLVDFVVCEVCVIARGTFLRILNCMPKSILKFILFSIVGAMLLPSC